jgi:hypothetical protein
LFVVDRMLEMCKERGDMIWFYGSTRTNRMIRAPAQKARYRGYPLLLSMNPKDALSCIPPSTVVHSARPCHAVGQHCRVTEELQL